MASVDRLSEVIGSAPTQSDELTIDICDSDGVKKYMQIYFRLDNCIKQLHRHKTLLDHEKINIKQSKQKNREIIQQTNDLLVTAKTEYSIVKQYHSDLKNKSDLQSQQFSYKTQKLNKITIEIASQINDIRQIDTNNKIMSIRLIAPDVDSTVIDRIENNTMTDDQFEHLCRSAIVGESLKEAVQQIEERHGDIKKLEQSVIEVHELFKDMAVLVDQQQEVIDVISQRISTAKNHVIVAEKDLVVAEKSQKKGRGYKCCALICGLIVLMIVLIPVIGVALKDS
jgi:t-SNARE complex subunit (syntaxin)